ncbi:MAG: acyl-CoA thioesterase [Rhodospirillales bacterium]|nr:acyl-CoA thioesterase [Rhodospirillales bacterium]
MVSRFPFSTTQPVRFTHTDPASYVFFPRYFEMFQGVVEDFFTLGLGQDYAALIMEHGYGLPTAHTECDFAKPCRLGEQLTFSMYLEKVGRSSMTIIFIGSVGAEERLRAKSVLVAIDMNDEGRPVTIGKELRRKMEDYMESCPPIPEKPGSR